MKVQILELKKEEKLWITMLSTHFNIHYNTTRWYSHVVAELVRLFGKKKEKEVLCFITNAVRAKKHRAIGMKIPRDKNCYTGNKQGVSYKRMMELLDLLEEKGYTDLYIGGVETWKNGEPDRVEQSVTVMKEKLMVLLDSVEMKDKPTTKDVDLVEITERSTKKQLNTQGVSGVQEVRKTVFEFNSALVESRISLKGIDLPSQHYKRVFIENLETGGRWYNASGGVQTMDRTLRPYLRIDGEELVELDYSAMHAGVLYEQLGVDVGSGFDPYAVEIMEDYFDCNAVEQFKERHNKPNYKPDRNLIKMMVMIGLNAKDKTQALRAISQKAGMDRKKIGRPEEAKCEYFGLVGEDFKDIYSRISEHNRLISHHFFSDIGVKLQNIDSEILNSVICDLLAQGEICLPYHDGLLVKRRHKDLVIDSMYKAWYKRLGSIQYCKVEEK